MSLKNLLENWNDVHFHAKYVCLEGLQYFIWNQNVPVQFLGHLIFLKEHSGIRCRGDPLMFWYWFGSVDKNLTKYQFTWRLSCSCLSCIIARSISSCCTFSKAEGCFDVWNCYVQMHVIHTHSVLSRRTFWTVHLPGPGLHAGVFPVQYMITAPFAVPRQPFGISLLAQKDNYYFLWSM